MRLRFSSSMLGLVSVVLIFGLSPAQAQSDSSRRVFTSADYERAEKFAAYNTAPLVYHDVHASWLPDDRLWYRDAGPDGSQFVVFDPASGKRQPLFDHAKIAASLSSAAGATYAANHLPFTSLQFSLDGKSFTVNIKGKRFRCDLQGGSCTGEEQPAAHNGGNESLSPDGKKAAFIRDYNLWVRDTDSNRETQLTTDGVKDFGYATDNAGWIHSDRPVLLWSPDSKKIATFQQDQRGVGEMYLVETKVGHPILQQWKYPLPGDEKITTIQRVVINLDGPRVVRLQMPADQHRSTLCDDVRCGAGWTEFEWSPDATSLAFVSTSRDHKHEWMRIADPSTGAIREVFDETAATQFESGQGMANWHYLPKSNEIIWYSERDNWGHLYLYDLASGRLKNQITTGDWVVTELLKIDERNRQLYFVGLGREPGNPYYEHLYRIGFDGKGLTLLTPEEGTHVVSLSPSGRFFVDSYSQPNVPAVAVARDSSGKMIAALEKTDISRLLATGWKPPTPFSFKGRDGVTDVWGLFVAPSTIDSNKKYPIVDSIYPGPQGGSVGSWSFTAGHGTEALAELGFAVVAIEGMGNPKRSKKFHDTYYGNMGDNTLPDQMLGIKSLASKYPWIDIDRVGIYGGSGGGFATADAMFRYPDFFKVGVSMSGNHDNREYEDDWGERYQGLLVKNPDGTTNYDDQANQLIAKNLKGHLLLTHGTIDDNVPPYNTLLVVDALIKANKDFDLIFFPNQHHGYGTMQDYMTRRMWDYFVRYLLNSEPPHEYQFHRPAPTY